MRRFSLMVLGLACTLGAVAPPAAAQSGTASPHGKLALECATCHGPQGWTPVRISASFNHGKLGFPLNGAHGSATCRACHQSLDFKGTKTDCASCHQDVHRGELGADCGRCHTPRSFLDRTAMTRAHQLTRFPLEGAHLSADCASCHTPTAQGGLQFVSRTTTCVGCHQTDYASAKDPDHQAGGFPRDCEQCHAVTVWSQARFNHDGSGFPLTGAHRALFCSQCHINNRFTGTPAQCVGCHQTEYNKTTDPAHQSAGFPTECTTCHSTVAWQPAKFDHSATQFPLTGAHKAVACDQCHGDGVYKGKPTQCAACHQTDYNQTTNPNHQAAGFPTDCASCHTTVQWQGATFDHDGAFFPIYSGRHRGTWTDCATCHTSPTNFQVFTCLSCHAHNQADMDSAHQGKSGYQYVSTECLRCHPRGSSN
ncbi:MAG TPA: hypothetical protein VNH46_12620 [Gemmatimonadales bacterium]|nr:hypothetical protein [Gemmatimonadales bacterium]